MPIMPAGSSPPPGLEDRAGVVAQAILQLVEPFVRSAALESARMVVDEAMVVDAPLQR